MLQLFPDEKQIQLPTYTYIIMNKEDILNKLDKNESLTREEELFYLVEILGHTHEDAKRILEINDNKDPNIIID